MRLSLQIAVVVVVTYLVGTLVAAWSLPSPKAPSINEAEFQTRNAKLDAIFRNPVPTLRMCGLIVPQGTAVISASHGRLVRVSRCLERRNLITALELRAVEGDKTLHLGGSRIEALAVRESGWVGSKRSSGS